MASSLQLPQLISTLYSYQEALLKKKHRKRKDFTHFVRVSPTSTYCRLYILGHFLPKHDAESYAGL
jgi:hypothetical protein